MITLSAQTAGLIVGYFLFVLVVLTALWYIAWRRKPCPPTEARGYVVLKYKGPFTVKDNVMQLKATQKFTVEVEGRDSKGNVAPLENPIFSVSPAEIGTFEVDPDNPQKGTFVANGVGSGQLAFVADGIVGEGEQLIEASEPINVLPGDAVTVAFNLGAVEEQ